MNEEFQTPSIPNPTEVEDLKLQLNSAYKRIEELDTEHTKIGSVVMTMAKLLGVFPVETNNTISLLNNIHYNLINDIQVDPKNDIELVITQLSQVEALLNFVIHGPVNLPVEPSSGFEQYINKTDTVQPNNIKQNSSKVKLKIPCEFVSGRLQIGYLRDENGVEHTFERDKKNLAFYINVEIDEYLLNKKIPEFNGVINKNGRN